MKKTLLLSLFFLYLLAGCQKDNDPAPGERPEERLSEALRSYKNQLVSAEHGWIGVLYPGSGGGYHFHIRFNQNDRMVMAADINATTAAPMESTYRLKTMQRPTLIFDTYSYLHILSDPDETISGGDRGQGLSTDFEFAFESATSETITLRGNFRGTELVLTKATADQAANFIPAITAAAQAFENTINLKTYFKRLTVGNRIFDVSVNTSRRIITFTYGENNAQQRFSSNYYFTRDGLVLTEPFVSQGLTITGFTNIQYDAANNRINLRVNDVAATVMEMNRPAFVNLAGARNLVINTSGDDYWITGGFETADNDDLYNVFSIPNMYFIAFWPRFSNSPRFDLFGYVLQNPTTNAVRLAYGPALTSTVTPDGRIIFTFFGNYEDLYQNVPPVPEEHQPIITATTEQLTNAQGYYFVQESNNEAVLVSAADARIWLRLFR